MKEEKINLQKCLPSKERILRMAAYNRIVRSFRSSHFTEELQAHKMWRITNLVEHYDPIAAPRVPEYKGQFPMFVLPEACPAKTVTDTAGESHERRPEAVTGDGVCGQDAWPKAQDAAQADVQEPKEQPAERAESSRRSLEPSDFDCDRQNRVKQDVADADSEGAEASGELEGICVVCIEKSALFVMHECGHRGPHQTRPPSPPHPMGREPAGRLAVAPFLRSPPEQLSPPRPPTGGHFRPCSRPRRRGGTLRQHPGGGRRGPYGPTATPGPTPTALGGVRPALGPPFAPRRVLGLMGRHLAHPPLAPSSCGGPPSPAPQRRGPPTTTQHPRRLPGSPAPPEQRGDCPTLGIYHRRPPYLLARRPDPGRFPAGVAARHQCSPGLGRARSAPI